MKKRARQRPTASSPGNRCVAPIWGVLSAPVRSISRSLTDYVRFTYIAQYANEAQDPPCTPKTAALEHRVPLEQAAQALISNDELLAPKP